MVDVLPAADDSVQECVIGPRCIYCCLLSMILLVHVTSAILLHVMLFMGKIYHGMDGKHCCLLLEFGFSFLLSVFEGKAELQPGRRTL